MKHFKTPLIVAAIAASFSGVAAAQNFTIVPIETPASVQHAYGVALNDQGLAALHMRLPYAAEIDFDHISSFMLSDLGLPEDFDPETDELTYRQYISLVMRLEDRVNSVLNTQRLAFNFAGDYDGQTVRLPALLNPQGDGASSNDNSADHQFLGLNQNNVRVGIASAPYTRFDHTYQPPTPEEGETPDPVTISYAKRDFTSRGIWYDGQQLKLVEPLAQDILGGESAIFDINEHHVAVGFQSVALTPRSAEIWEKDCEKLADDPSSTITPYTCMWNIWHAEQRANVTNLPSYMGTPVASNGSIYDVEATVWQLDVQGNVISETRYAPLMERLEDDPQHFSTYAFAVNNNGIAVGQSWTYHDSGEEDEELTPASRVRLPVVFIDGETRAMTTHPDYLWGSAADINDDNIAVGYVLRMVQGQRRAIPFQYDVDTETFSELPAFFKGSSTYPKAVNNQGIVVGTAEIDYSLDTIRRQAGFYLDLNNLEQGLINLNDVVGCETTHFIVSADAINEQNQILVTSVIEQRTEDSDGLIVGEQVAQTLLLNPFNGDFEGCDDNEGGSGGGGSVAPIERQGASMHWPTLLGMFLLGGLITIRRKFRL